MDDGTILVGIGEWDQHVADVYESAAERRLQVLSVCQFGDDAPVRAAVLVDPELIATDSLCNYLTAVVAHESQQLEDET